MPVTRRTKTFSADAERIWRVLADPHHLPRWWPRVSRVESADTHSWTQVMMTAKGKPVRADFQLVEASENHVYAWEQQLVGTPFGRLLVRARTEVTLTPAAAGGTDVQISVDQKLRGWARFGPFLFKRAARTQLDEALSGLEQASV